MAPTTTTRLHIFHIKQITHIPHPIPLKTTEVGPPLNHREKEEKAKEENVVVRKTLFYVHLSNSWWSEVLVN